MEEIFSSVKKQMTNKSVKKKRVILKEKFNSTAIIEINEICLNLL